jgi:hypothetical protein
VESARDCSLGHKSVKTKVFSRLNHSLKGMTEEKPEILAVHKQKLERFLTELGLWEPFSKGEFKCVVCGKTITIDSIGVIIPSGENIVFCCSNPDCLLKATRKQEFEPQEAELEDAEE